MKYITTFQVADPESRKAEIKAILDSGKWVKFTYHSGVVKIVKEWNPDEDGDLTADYTEASKFVCPTAMAAYSFEAIQPNLDIPAALVRANDSVKGWTHEQLMEAAQKGFEIANENN